MLNQPSFFRRALQRRKLAAYIAVSVFGVICTAAVATTHDVVQEVASSPAQAPDRASRMSELIMTAMTLIGVNYKFGGNTPESGFDCSGLVRHLFNGSFGISLPRTSHELVRHGKAIEKTALEIGDLVFYNTRRRAYSHVGIYIGEGRFIHAPSRGRSVETVDMSNSYWVKRFNGARRLVANDVAVSTTSSADAKHDASTEIDYAPLS
jgi:cell wall-associated NlpC family hydrolase